MRMLDKVSWKWEKCMKMHIRVGSTFLFHNDPKVNLLWWNNAIEGGRRRKSQYSLFPIKFQSKTLNWEGVIYLTKLQFSIQVKSIGKILPYSVYQITSSCLIWFFISSNYLLQFTFLSLIYVSSLCSFLHICHICSASEM